MALDDYLEKLDSDIERAIENVKRLQIFMFKLLPDEQQDAELGKIRADLHEIEKQTR